MLELGNREREIMEVVYRLGRASVRDVLAELEDPPSYSAVRAMMRILEDKGLLTHAEEGRRYVYAPAKPKRQAQRSTLARVVTGLFNGSAGDALVTLLEIDPERLTDEELDELERRIAAVRGERKSS